MKELGIILFFILGLIFGSFYNVVGFRLSTNKSLINPKRSFCPNCNHTLKVLDLVPILSYICLKGRCRYCYKKISIFYPIVELFTGLLFAVSFYSFSFSYDLVIVLSLVSLFSIIIVSDLNYYIIPDQVTLVFGIIIFITNLLRYGIKTGLLYLLYGFIMFVIMYLIGLLGKVLFKQEALGGGDIKLLFVLGMTLPLVVSVFGIVLASLLALPVSVFLIIKHKDKIVPFGPFLVAAYLLLYMFKIDIESVYKLFTIISF